MRNGTTTSTPSEPRDVFGPQYGWWRLKETHKGMIGDYRMIPETTPSGEYVRIVALPESEFEWYNPLEDKWSPSEQKRKPHGKRQRTQPEGPNSMDQQYAPHVHLARIDPDSEEDMLNFVLSWGLLGLWKVPSYREKSPALAPDKGFKESLFSDRISQWYIYKPYEGQPGKQFHQYCEPVDLFAEAVRDYQQLCERIQDTRSLPVEAYEVKNGVLRITKPEQNLALPIDAPYDVEQLFLLNDVHPIPLYDYKERHWGLGWDCPSLLHWIYLRTLLDLLGGHGIRRCAHTNCGRFFLAHGSRDRFCSASCGDAAAQADSRRRKRQHPVP
ncbi:MAG: hypothetical protein ACM3X4_01530 [Ignavibacteriales bacterium]